MISGIKNWRILLVRRWVLTPVRWIDICKRKRVSGRETVLGSAIGIWVGTGMESRERNGIWIGITPGESELGRLTCLPKSQILLEMGWKLCYASLSCTDEPVAIAHWYTKPISISWNSSDYHPSNTRLKHFESQQKKNLYTFIPILLKNDFKLLYVTIIGCLSICHVFFFKYWKF